MIRLPFFLFCLAATAPLHSGAAIDRTDQGKRLRAFFDAEWSWELEQHPEEATELGVNRYNDRLTDLSPRAIEARRARARRAAEELKVFDRSGLSSEDRLNLDLYSRDLAIEIEGFDYHPERMPLGPVSGIHLRLPSLVSQTPFRATRDYEMYLARLSAVPRQIEQTVALLREGVATGWVPPAIVLAKTPMQIQVQADGPVEKSPFFVPFTEFPEAVSAADRERLKAEGRRRIAEEVQPAFARLHDFVVREYLPHCRRDVGAWALPEGDAYYRWCVREHTTTELSPEEIHKLGLSEVDRIRAEMDKTIAETGFHGSFEQFLDFLRTDPRFTFKTPEDLVLHYRDIAKRIDPMLPTLFGRLPRNTYGVKVIPAAEAETTYPGYYQGGAADGSRAGYFMVNTSKLDTRKSFNMEVLTIHEAVPGHHFQISLAHELTDLPDFRRNAYDDAFGEGWALYCESLGKDLGLYEDAYSYFGYLSFDMWRACRLVVDTGLHSKHWTREQAIDYMARNTGLPLNDIAVEVDRYISWPGQALAYKIGQRKILELRERARRRLGEKFDIRRFHDCVLGEGSLPLDLLEKNIDRWIAEEAGH